MLTVSDGVARGEREDASGDLLAELLAGEGYDVVRRVVPDDRAEIAPGAPRARPLLPARAHDRRHGLRAARRDARGDRRRARPARARDRRGDPRRRGRAHAARRPLARARGNGRLDARRQPARLAGRVPRRVRGAPPRARARARAARRPNDAPATARRDGGARPLPEALRLAREDRAHGLRAALRLRRRVPRRRRCPLGGGSLLGHGGDARGALAGDGAQPADRRRDRRAQPENGRTRDPARRPVAAGRDRLLPCLAGRVPAGRVAARAARPLALADPGRDVRRLPVPEARDLARARLAGRGRRARAARRLDRGHERDAVGGVGARRRGRVLGRRLRPPLRALRPRDRPRPGTALVPDPLRRARHLLGVARLPRPDGGVPRADRASACRSARSTGSASPRSRACSRTSTRSSRRATSGGSTRRSSP